MRLADRAIGGLMLMILASSSSIGAENGVSYADESCANAAVFVDGVIRYTHQPKGGAAMTYTCSRESYWATGPVYVFACDNGLYGFLEFLPDNKIVFARQLLHLVTPNGAICD